MADDESIEKICKNELGLPKHFSLSQDHRPSRLVSSLSFYLREHGLSDHAAEFVAALAPHHALFDAFEQEWYAFDQDDYYDCSKESPFEMLYEHLRHPLLGLLAGIDLLERYDDVGDDGAHRALDYFEDWYGMHPHDSGLVLCHVDANTLMGKFPTAITQAFQLQDYILTHEDPFGWLEEDLDYLEKYAAENQVDAPHIGLMLMAIDYAA